MIVRWSRYGRVTPHPSEATRTSIYENTDLTTEDKMAMTNRNLPRMPEWFQSLKKIHHMNDSTNPSRITAATQ